MKPVSFFFDRYLNVKANSWQSQSENPSTFNAALTFSYIYNHRDDEVDKLATLSMFANKFMTNNYTWRTMENDPNPSWSLDEKISTLAVFSYYGASWWIDQVPLFPSRDNSSFWSWFRPDVLAYTIGSKWPWLRRLVSPIVVLKCKRSLKEFTRDPKNEASGAQLAFIMLMGWRKYHVLWRYSAYWADVFENYYPERDHPTRQLWV